MVGSIDRVMLRVHRDYRKMTYSYLEILETGLMDEAFKVIADDGEEYYILYKMETFLESKNLYLSHKHMVYRAGKMRLGKKCENDLLVSTIWGYERDHGVVYEIFLTKKTIQAIIDDGHHIDLRPNCAHMIDLPIDLHIYESGKISVITDLTSMLMSMNDFEYSDNIYIRTNIAKYSDINEDDIEVYSKFLVTCTDDPDYFMFADIFSIESSGVTRRIDNPFDRFCLNINSENFGVVYRKMKGFELNHQSNLLTSKFLKEAIAAGKISGTSNQDPLITDRFYKMKVNVVFDRNVMTIELGRDSDLLVENIEGLVSAYEAGYEIRAARFRDFYIPTNKSGRGDTLVFASFPYSDHRPVDGIPDPDSEDDDNQE